MVLHRRYQRAHRACTLMLLRAVGDFFLIICASGAFGQTFGETVGPDRLELATNGLKTCFQSHYDAGSPKVAADQAGDALVEACRRQWDAARSVCMAQPGKTRDACNARMTMMLLGFAPVK